MTTDEWFMQRCFELAELGRQKVSPNPMVGAVLRHGDRIIGEGFHREYGQAHAEVHAIGSVAEGDRPLLSQSTLYVSLEPCCFYGNTPPCTNLIIEKKIPRVVISCLDDTPAVAGKGVAQLRQAGVDVTVGVLEETGRRLSAARRIYVLERRPYIILKYARSLNGMFAAGNERPFWITNPYSKRLVHKWRSEVDAILVGTQTALIDNPRLTTRLFPGASPLRIVLDRKGRLPNELHLFDGSTPTLLVSERPAQGSVVEGLPLLFDEALLGNLLHHLYERRVGTLLVEGGRQLIESFLREGLWDEARIFIGSVTIPDGIPAPHLSVAPEKEIRIGSDRLYLYYRPEPE